MSVPQRWLDRRPSWVLPTLVALSALGAYVATQDYPRLMDSSGVWDQIEERRARLPSAYIGIPPVDRVLLNTNAALSLAAFPPSSVSSDDHDKFVAWSTDFFGSIPAVTALVAATANSNAYPLPYWFGTAIIGLIWHTLSGAALPSVLVLLALGTPRRAKRPDRRKHWTAFTFALLTCYVLPAIMAFYPRTFGLEDNGTTYPLLWQLSGILYMLYAPALVLVESIASRILPNICRARHVGWLVAALSAISRVVALHRLRIRPQTVFVLDETTLVGASTRLLQLDALVFYATIIAWTHWITGKGRTTVACVVYSLILGFGTGIGLLLDTV